MKRRIAGGFFAVDGLHNFGDFDLCGAFSVTVAASFAFIRVVDQRRNRIGRKILKMGKIFCFSGLSTGHYSMAPVQGFTILSAKTFPQEICDVIGWKDI